MAVRKIRIYGDPVLRKQCKAVKQITDDERQLMEDLIDTMYDANGLGLAAPQIGELKRIIVVREPDDEALVIVNPKVVDRSGAVEPRTEGCLSLPGLQGEVRRHYHVVVTGRGYDGRPLEYEGDEVVAQALCHEVEHLDGKLFIDKVEADTLNWVSHETSDETGEEETVLEPTTLTEVRERFQVEGR